MAEMDGISRAIFTVKEKSNEIQKQGMSPVSFTFGLLNVVISTFILGNCPQHFWFYQSLICGPLLVWVWNHKRKKKEALYMLDLCWVISALLCLYSVVCLLQLCRALLGSSEITLRYVTASPMISTALFAMACGPLGWGVVFVGNALVLHDPSMTASLIIHMVPPLLMWALRWHHTAVQSAYPGLFGMESGDEYITYSAVWQDGLLPGEDGECTREEYFDPYAFRHFLFPSSALYFCWWIPYCIWLVFFGIKHSPKVTGQQTVWSLTLANSPSICKMLTGVSRTEDTVRPFAAFLYMAWHAVACHLSFVFAYLCFKSFTLHSLFCISMFVYAVHAGSVRYFKMTTKWYCKAVEHLLQDERGNSPQLVGRDKKD